MTIVTYVLYFFFYSAVGWLGESIYCSVGARKWVNRGFLKGPMCPIYGTGALAMAITLTPVKNLDIRVPMFGHDVLITPLLVFIAGMVVCDIVEFITSVLMESSSTRDGGTTRARSSTFRDASASGTRSTGA